MSSCIISVENPRNPIAQGHQVSL
uniref:Uncharacterized protein n=1 Tax=Arundo donax TaxID=35708 RepID=A0A0A9FWD0_ARUDO